MSLSTKKLNKHHLLSIKWGLKEYGWPAYWTFVFEDDSTVDEPLSSPSKGSYKFEPDCKQIMPHEKDYKTFQFKSCCLYLYSICIHSEEKMVCEITPQETQHYATDTVTLRAGERLVSANWTLNEARDSPVKLQLMIYNAL